jgi:hypothetical protein
MTQVIIDTVFDPDFPQKPDDRQIIKTPSINPLNGTQRFNKL